MKYFDIIWYNMNLKADLSEPTFILLDFGQECSFYLLICVLFILKGTENGVKIFVVCVDEVTRRGSNS